MTNSKLKLEDFLIQRAFLQREQNLKKRYELERQKASLCTFSPRINSKANLGNELRAKRNKSVLEPQNKSSSVFHGLYEDGKRMMEKSVDLHKKAQRLREK